MVCSWNFSSPLKSLVSAHPQPHFLATPLTLFATAFDYEAKHTVAKDWLVAFQRCARISNLTKCRIASTFVMRHTGYCSTVFMFAQIKKNNFGDPSWFHFEKLYRPLLVNFFQLAMLQNLNFHTNSQHSCHYLAVDTHQLRARWHHLMTTAAPILSNLRVLLFTLLFSLHLSYLSIIPQSTTPGE